MTARTTRGLAQPTGRTRAAVNGIPVAAPGAARVLALQQAAGNGAVSGLLSNAVLQRSPGTWAVDTAEIVRLKGGNGLTSHWPPVLDEVKTYSRLDPHDHTGRTATLKRLETAIARWQQNQSKNWWSDELDQKKAIAVSSLLQMIIREQKEMYDSIDPYPSTLSSPPLNAPGSQPRSARSDPRTQRNDTPPSVQEGLFTFDFDFEIESPRGETKESATSVRTPLSSSAPTGDESDSVLATPRTDFAELTSRVARREALPEGVYLRVHFTKTINLAPIHQDGLFAGRGKGIGDPSEGRPDKDYVYGVDLENRKTTGFVSGEAGGEPVGIISSHGGDRDINYPTGAVRYSRAAPPVRDLRITEPAETTYSFPLPLTPRSTTALTAFVNRAANPPMSETKVVNAVEGALLYHSLLTFSSAVGPAQVTDPSTQ